MAFFQASLGFDLLPSGVKMAIVSYLPSSVKTPLYLALEPVASRLAVPGVEGHTLRSELILHGALCPRFRERIHTPDIAGNHEIGHVRFAVLHQLDWIQLRARLQDNGHHNLVFTQ